MPLEKIDFTQETEFVDLGFKHQEHGPVSTFNKSLDKEDIRKAALEEGYIEGNFQFAGPFTDSQQKKVRQEVFRVKGLIEIMGDALTADIGTLRPVAQSYNLYAERVIHEAVLVEAARRAAFAVAVSEGGERAQLVGRGEASDDIEFCKQLMIESMEALYPKPDREMALDNLGLFHSCIERLMDNDETRGFAEQVLAEYPFLAESAGRRPAVLQPDKQAEIKAYFTEKFNPIFSKVRPEIGELNNENLTEATKLVIEELGYLDQGWRIIYVGNQRVGFYVDPASRTVEVGERTKQITWDVFEKLMVHEVGVHITRSVNAYTHAGNTAATGWIDYEGAEEGLAIVAEKSWAGKASVSGVIDRENYRYLIGAYSTGAIDGVPHSADESFRFAVKLNMLSSLGSKIKAQETFDLHKTEQAARSAVFEYVFRFFRGMPDGLVMIKDIAYYDGAQKMINLFNQSDRPLKELLDELMRGKYNPFIPLQVEVMDAIYENPTLN